MYLGRVVSVGELPDGREFIAYAVSGRSDPSRARKARIIEESDVRKVNIGPLDLDNLNPEQEKMKQWIFYNGIITDFRGEERYVLASNGEQTDAAQKLFDNQHDIEIGGLYAGSAMATAMMVLGPERDKYKTPRIAGVISSVCSTELFISTEDGDFRDFGGSTKGTMDVVSTYQGKKDSNNVIVPTGEVKIPMGTLDLQGNTAQEIANNLYDWMDPDLVVCTAVALVDSGYSFVDLAVRNLHQD